MKANNTTIENALRLAFSPEYVNALSLVELAETWSDNHNARDLELNIAAYAEQGTYKMEQEGAMLEFDAWERLTAEIERIARVWVSLYCNEISWSNRPEWLANSVRAALNTTTAPETPNPENNTPATMNANETIANTPANLAKLHALAVNGTPMFYIWLDAVDDAATTSVYLTEKAARADITRLEADDKEAGIYEPDAYSIINAAPYFA